MRGGMLLVGMSHVALYVALSVAFESGMAPDAFEVRPTSEIGGAARMCTGCHVLSQMENSVGPHLVGVVDRRAGAVPDFTYSDAMRQVDIRWTRERLREFLVDPHRVVPGTSMPAIRLDEDAAEAIVNFLSLQR